MLFEYYDDAVNTATRPSLSLEGLLAGNTQPRKLKRTPEDHERAIELMAYRYEKKLDLWTGLPLPNYAKNDEIGIDKNDD